MFPKSRDLMTLKNPRNVVWSDKTFRKDHRRFHTNNSTAFLFIICKCSLSACTFCSTLKEKNNIKGSG